MLKFLVLFGLVSVAYSRTVTVGQVYEYAGQVHKVHEVNVEASGIPLVKREKEVYVELPGIEQKIKGIMIRDEENGLAEPSINRGGLGFNFVNIKLKSERSSGFKFHIEVFA